MVEDWGAGLILDLTCLEDLHSASNFEFGVAHFLPEPVAVSGPPKIEFYGKYSGSPNIDTPKIDIFYDNSRKWVQECLKKILSVNMAL